MRLLRGRLRLGAMLALFALAVQLVAAFGHIHKEDFAGIPAPGSAAAFRTSAPGNPQQTPVAPAHDDHDLTCSICASVALAGTLLLSAPPAIVMELVPAETLVPASPSIAASIEERRGFQARAPPA